MKNYRALFGLLLVGSLLLGQGVQVAPGISGSAPLTAAAINTACSASGGCAIVKRLSVAWAACSGGASPAASPGWTLGASNSGTTACTSDDQAANQPEVDADIYYLDGVLPADFVSFNSFQYAFTTTDATTTHTVINTLAIYCTSGVPASGPTYLAATTNTITIAGGAISYTGTMSSLTTTGCVAGNYFRLKFTRSTDTATNAVLVGWPTFAYNGSNQ